MRPPRGSQRAPAKGSWVRGPACTAAPALSILADLHSQPGSALVRRRREGGRPRPARPKLRDDVDTAKAKVATAAPGAAPSEVPAGLLGGMIVKDLGCIELAPALTVGVARPRPGS